MRQLPTRIGAVAALALALTACGGPTQPSVTPGSPTAAPSTTAPAGLTGELHVLTVAGPTASWVEAAIPEFGKSHPDLKIVQSTETNQNLLASAAQLYSSDSAPDLGFMQINMSAYPLLREAGELQPMNEVWSAAALAENLPESIANGPWKVGDDYYGIPSSQVWAPVIYYNKDAFKAAGIEVSDGHRPSEAEFLGWIGKLKAAGLEGLAVGGGDFPAKHLTAAVLQSQTTADVPWAAYLSNAPLLQDKELYSQGPFLETLKTVERWNQQGVFPSGTSGMTAPQAESLFASGAAGMLSGGSFTVAGIKSSEPKFEIGWMVYPTTEAGTETTFQLYAGSGFVIPKKAKNTQAAVEFAKFLASTEGMAILAGTGNIPTRTDVPSDSFGALDPLIQSMLSKFEQVGTADIWSPNQAVEVALVTGFGELLIGQTTPDKLAADLQAAVKAAAG